METLSTTKEIFDSVGHNDFQLDDNVKSGVTFQPDVLNYR